MSPATATAPQPWQLFPPVDASETFFESTCLRANIHFPVDWVLLRDAARPLMKATGLIHRAGLKQRMPQEPLRFLSAMYKLAMARSAGTRRPAAKQQRQRTLRQLKTLEQTIARHAQSHRDLLAARHAETELSKKQAQAIFAPARPNLGAVACRHRASPRTHHRGTSGTPRPLAEKILSL